MDTAAAAINSLPAIPNGDPFVDFLKWAVVLLIVALVGARPLMTYIRQANADKAENSKDSAESALYTHLADQISQYRGLADQAFKERNDLIIRVVQLEMQIERFNDLKEAVHQLETKLDKKDALISDLVRQGIEERSAFLETIKQRDARIGQLEQSQRDMQDRLTRDESMLGIPVSCPLAAKSSDEV